MKAIVIDDNKNLVWKDVKEPQMSSGDVLVRVCAAAVNRADIMQVDGEYPPPEGCPEWPGLEISGIIEKVSDDVLKKGKWKIGDKVCALLGGGGYAQYVVVPEGMLMRVPENITMTEAAAIPEAFATAYLNLFIEGGAKKGDTLLMNAGASGLASVIIPMAKAFGLRVITTVLSQKTAESIKHLEADVVVDTSKESIIDVLKNEDEKGHPVNIAIDCLGGEIVGECFAYLAYGCRWIMIATLAGDITKVNLRTMFIKNIRLIGSTLRSKPQIFKEQLLKRLVDEIWPKVEQGEIRPTVYKTYDIKEANEAHKLLRDGKSAGKVVLIVDRDCKF